jgi:anti-anti-sigma regulatory factor
MEITVSHEQGRVPVTIIKIKGSIVGSDEIEKVARQEIDGGARYLLVDLADVPFMATAGLRALHALFTLLRANTAKQASAGTQDNADVKKGIAAGTYASPNLKLLNPSKHVAESLRLAGYDMFLEIHHDRRKALTSF